MAEEEDLIDIDRTFKVLEKTRKEAFDNFMEAMSTGPIGKARKKFGPFYED